MSAEINAQDVFGRTISFSTDGSKDYYLIGGATTLEFPVGTPDSIVLLAVAKQGKLEEYQAAITDYSLLHYDVPTRTNILALYVHAQQTGLTDRKAYIEQLFAWMILVIEYCANFVNTVNSQTTPEDVANLKWDFDSAGVDPKVTAIQAIQILT